jgi:hypothetical protein
MVGGGDKGGDIPKPKTKPKLKGKKGKGGLGFVERMDPKKMIAGAAAMLIVSAALWVTAKALQQFNTVDWPSLGKAALALLGLTAVVVGLSFVSGPMIVGSLAMLIMSGALYVLGASLNLFNTVEWESLAVAGVALVGLALVTAGLGFMAPLIMLGSAALIVMSVGLGIFAVSGALFASVAPSILLSLQGFASLDGGALLNTAGGLAGLAGSLYLLAPALFLIGAAGLFALPALMGLKALGINVLSGGGAVDATGGDDKQVQLDSIRQAVEHMAVKMDSLVAGFGGDTSEKGVYLKSVKENTMNTKRAVENLKGI